MFGLFKDKNKAIIDKMEEWLAHPNEEGRKPDFSEVVFSGSMFNPANGKEVPAHLVFYKYLADKSEGIGMIGPLTWAFADFDIQGLKYPAILSLYGGWFLAFFCSKTIAQKTLTSEQFHAIADSLAQQGAVVATDDANSPKIIRTTNANGDFWITLPVHQDGKGIGCRSSMARWTGSPPSFRACSA